MPEDLPAISPDVRDIPFGVVVGEAMEDLGRSLGNYPPAFKAITLPAFEVVSDGKPYPEIVYFDEGGKSYGYSASFRETDDEHIPEDAITLTEGANTFFLQVSHSIRDSGRLKGEAELVVGDVVYKDQAAIDHAPEVFPRFFPLSDVRLRERLRYKDLVEKARRPRRERAA